MWGLELHGGSSTGKQPPVRPIAPNERWEGWNGMIFSLLDQLSPLIYVELGSER